MLIAALEDIRFKFLRKKFQNGFKKKDIKLVSPTLSSVRNVKKKSISVHGGLVTAITVTPKL